MKVGPLAGEMAGPMTLVNVRTLATVFYPGAPDPAIREQRVNCETSRHRGCAIEKAFNERHILVISQAISRYGRTRGVVGPLVWRLTRQFRYVANAYRQDKFGGGWL